MPVARGDLDLGQLLGEDAVHYRGVLAGQDPVLVPRQASRAQPLGEIDVVGVERFSEELPDTASSCTALALRPEICWDVCGYYADLGVHWKASRRELKRAYYARGGESSQRLTYVLKQLLKDAGAVRRRYDALWFGELFMEDADTERMLRRAAGQVVRRRKGGAEAEVEDVEDVLREWGLNFYRRDQVPQQETSLQAAGEDPMYVAGDGRWLEEWGWYGISIWQIPARAGEILGEWQRLLAAELSSRGIVTRFAVGLDPDLPAGRTRIWHNGPNGSAIFFTGTEQQSPETARDAVHGYREAQHDEG